MTFSVEKLPDDYKYPKMYCDEYIKDDKGNKVKGGMIMCSTDNGTSLEKFEDIRNMELTEKSILLATYPRSGTTVTNTFLAAMLNGFSNLTKNKKGLEFRNYNLFVSMKV